MIGYKNHDSIYGNTCFYCGEKANTKDHFPPKSGRFVYTIQRLLIRSCLECNVYLGKSMQPSLQERKKAAMKRFLVYPNGGTPKVGSTILGHPSTVKRGKKRGK